MIINCKVAAGMLNFWYAGVFSHTRVKIADQKFKALSDEEYAQGFDETLNEVDQIFLRLSFADSLEEMKSILEKTSDKIFQYIVWRYNFRVGQLHHRPGSFHFPDRPDVCVLIRLVLVENKSLL